jgi:streptogramin lyase
VELAFENGSSVVVKPGSEFSIDQFLADPFDSQEVDYGSLENEPTMSVTRTNLKSGEIFFHVEKLKERSTYEIITPVGIAGIRGTGGFVRSGKGKGAFGLYEGAAIFKTPNGQVHSVRQGQAITVGDAATQYAVTGNPPKSAEILSSAKERMAEVEKETPAHPFEDKPLAGKEEKKDSAFNNSASAFIYEPPVVMTLAGSGVAAFTDGQGVAASFNGPRGVAVDANGSVYVADTENNRVRKISASGMVTTLAGSGVAAFADGQGVAASFNRPRGVAADANGNVYVADTENNRIRKISASGMVTTLAGSGVAAFADGQGVAASFAAPKSVAVDESCNVYVVDADNNKIRKISPSGVVTTVAGSGKKDFRDGAGAEASFFTPVGIAVDSNSNIYVSEIGDGKIRKINSNGIVSTLADSGLGVCADGSGSPASFNVPFGLTVDRNGNIYVAEIKNHKIRKITPDGLVTTLAGSGKTGAEEGYSTAASFNSPWGVAIDEFGAVYVADQGNNKIRKISPSGY